MYFKDKTVWITGASSDLGKALALELAKRGAELILSSRNAEKLEAVRRQCLAHNAKADVQPLDLERYMELGAVAERVLQRHPKIDLLINNGGVSLRGYAMETSIEADRRLMDINYMGTVALTKAVLPSMLKHDMGQIVAISSLVGKFGAPLCSSYSASKHALHGFFDSLRAELDKEGKDIQIGIICPGYVHTGVSGNALTGDGSRDNVMDEATEKGLAPKVFAKKALKAIRQQRRETHIGGREVLGVWLKRFLPGVFADIIAGAKVV